MWLGRLGPVEVIFWTTATLAIGTFGWLRLRRPGGGSTGRVLGMITLASPILCLIATFACFSGAGHPLMQYNADAGLDRWSTWAGLWPMLVLACLACTVLSFGLGLGASRWPRRAEGLLLLTVLNGISLFCVSANWPSA